MKLSYLYFKNVLRDKMPFVVMIGGAVSLFLFNYISKLVYPELYNILAYILTFCSIVFTFGAFGADQLVLRDSWVKNGKLYVPTYVVACNLLSACVFILFYLFFLNGRLLSYEINSFLVVLVVLSLSLSKFFYQVGRASKQFFFAQLFSVGWKLLLPIALVFFGSATVEESMFYVFSILLALLTLNARSFYIVNHKKKYFYVFSSLSFSLFVMSMITNLDRFLVDNEVSSQQFSEYIYFLTIMVMPFNMIASYFGFKEAVTYKRSYAFRKMISLALKRTSSVLVLYSISAIVVFSAKDFFLIKVEWEVFLVSGVVVICKTFYSFLSAAMGVLATAQQIFLANIATLISTPFVFILALFYNLSIESVLLLALLPWCVRLISYMHCLSNIRGINDKI